MRTWVTPDLGASGPVSCAITSSVSSGTAGEINADNQSDQRTPDNVATDTDDPDAVPRQLYLPVHLLGLDALLGCVGAVAGDVKLQDDGVMDHPINRRRGGHGLAKMRSHSEKTRFDVMPSDRRS